MKRRVYINMPGVLVKVAEYLIQIIWAGTQPL